MKTGIYIRFERDGKWQTLDIADLSEEEFSRFIDSQKGREDIWARGLHKWIVDNINFMTQHGVIEVPGTLLSEVFRICVKLHANSYDLVRIMATDADFLQSMMFAACDEKIIDAQTRDFLHDELEDNHASDTSSPE